MTTEIWTTATLTIDTPNGERFQGVSYVGSAPRRSMPDMRETLPRNARIKYESPLRVHANYAYEMARSRTIHHNVWHDGSEDVTRVANLHLARYCHER